MKNSIPSAEALFDNAACGLVLIAAAGKILKVNQTLCSWLGYQPEDLVETKRLQDLFTIGGKIFYQTHWEPLLQIQGSVVEMQMDMMHKDGTKVPTLMNAIRRQSGSQDYIEVAILAATDRKKYEHELLYARQRAENSNSELRKLQQELQQANAMLSEVDRRKDEFLATLAHELRAPLAPINNVLNVLKIKQLNDPNIIWALDIIDRQMVQLTHLIDDLMDLSRISQARLTLRKKPLSLKPILLQSIESCKSLIDLMGHELIVDIPDTDIILMGDSTRLIQIFSNLITNAAKYTLPGGKISVDAKLINETVEINISDSGIGIAENQLDKIFEIFSQLEPALERTQEGLGIGLALVRGLVELHGGEIHAFSAGEGKGSRFTVRLKIYTGEIVKDADTVSSIAPHPQHKILIIDDHLDSAHSLAIALDLLNYQTRFANSGFAGLAAGAQFQPDAVILDIGLPDINGYEVAKRIRLSDWGKNLLLIAATGWGQEKDKDLAKESGFDFHLTKPIDFAQLNLTLRQLDLPEGTPRRPSPFG